MPKIQLLEPSFAEAIKAIEQASSIAPSKRMHWACSLRQIAKLLDRPPQSIAARWVAVAHQVNQLHHAGSGLEWKTLANHKSNAKSALLWFRNENRLPLHGAPLRPAWQRLRSRIVDPSHLAKLSGLCRFCSFKGIDPDAVGEAVVDDYMSYRLETTALAADNKARRAIARAWNSSSTQIEGWPQHRLIEPPLKGRGGLHWGRSRGHCKV